jgi:CheY-like chemotaxis protein
MLEGLLDLARLEAGIVAPNIGDIALDDLLHRLAVEFNGPAQAAGLQLDMPGTSLVASSDPLLLELILRNLLANAIKYTAHGGVTVECREMAGTVRIAVIDTGRGIPTDQLAAIFEEFWQLDNPARDRARGFGLGLAVVERAARLLGCHVEVHSEVGRGSLFALTVPLNPNRAAVSPAPVRAENGVPEEHLAGRTILVVEDDPAIRLALAMLLQEWGLAVRAASSVEDAAALLEQLHQRPDVMLVDYRLPNGKCGTEAVALVHRRWPVPAILMTGDTAPERLADAMRSGCQLLHKPVDALKLKQALVDCL